MHYEYAPIQIINIQFITVGYIVQKLCNKEERGIAIGTICQKKNVHFTFS